MTNKKNIYALLILFLAFISCKNEATEKVAERESVDQALIQEANQSNAKKYSYCLQPGHISQAFSKSVQKKLKIHDPK